MSDDLSRRHLLAEEKDGYPVEVKHFYPCPLQTRALLYCRGSLCLVSLILLMSIILNAVLLSETRPAPLDYCTQRSPYSISHSCNWHSY